MTEDPGIVVESAGGNCPVQIEGTVDGQPFYFRARGNRWSVSIGGTDVILAPEWSLERPYGTTPFEAGWMSLETAEAFLQEAIEIWRASRAEGMLA